MPNSKIYSFLKKYSLKEFSARTHGTQGNAWTVRWFCEPIILWIRHLEGPTEFQLNSC